MKKGKRIAAIAASMALTAAVAVGGTLAYLSAVTDTKTNTFSSSKNITTKLEETFSPTEAAAYTPGKVIAKVPTMTNTSSVDEPVYVAMTLNYTNGASTITPEQFAEYAQIQGLNVTDWKLVADAPDGTELYMYQTTVEKNKTTNAIFTGIKVNAGIKEVKKSGTTGKIIYTMDSTGKLIDVKDETKIVDDTTYYDQDGNVISAENAVAGLPTFEIKVQGYAVQSSDITGEEAKAELLKLAGTTLNTTFTAK